MTESEALLQFFKALADANRLKIVSLLAKQSYTVEQLAALLGVSASTVSHHLSKLSEAGLVTATAQSYYNYYRLETDKIEGMARRLLSGEALPGAASGVDTSALEQQELDYDQKVVRNYLLPNGRLKTIPSQRKKLMAVLRHLVNGFKPEQRYSEQEVNQILAGYHDDTASLRREMISAGLLERELSGRQYWRAGDSQK